MCPHSVYRKEAGKKRSIGIPNARAARGVARYYQLYELLSSALNDGTIPAGSAFPSEPELVARYKLSRTTVRKALARLEEEERIVRYRGSGTFARQSPGPTRLYLNLETFYADVPALASQTSISILRYELAPVPAALRELQPAMGTRALLVQRLLRYQGTPYQLNTTYIPESLAKRIRHSALKQASLLTVLDQIGPHVAKTEHTMGAVAADAIAARRLNVSLGTPLLRMRAVLIDRRGHTRAITESLCRPDRFRVRAALKRDTTRGSWRLKTR